EIYSPIEECKADIVGLHNADFLMRRGVLPESASRDAYATFLAGLFRSARFGVDEAHGQGTVVQFNWVRARGGIAVDPSTGKFSVDPIKARDAIRDLATALLVAEGRGSKSAAQEILDTWGKPDDVLRSALKKLEGIPIDIEPIYPARDA